MQQQQQQTRGGTIKCVLGWLFIAMIVPKSNSSQSPLENRTGRSIEKTESGIGLISPRMDYEEWTPLGRGDPLKNNPTFDYVPPVLDKVQYWLDSQTTEASTRRDILVLGLTAKKTSAPIPERFFDSRDSIDSQFTSTAKQPSIPIKGQLERRSDFTGSSGAEPPHILRISNFKHKFVSPNDHSDPRKTQRLPASYYPTRYYTHHGQFHTTRLLPDTHQLSHQPQDHHRSYPPVILSSGRLEDNINASSQKNYASSQKLFSKDRENVGAGASQAAGETNRASTGLLLPPRTSSATRQEYAAENQAASASGAGTVSVEKSSLIYQSSHTISGDDWLGAQFPSISKLQSQYTEYVADHDASPSVNRPVLIPANVTTLNEESSLSSSGTIAANITNRAPTLYKDPSEVYDQKTDHLKNYESGKTTEKMHIIVANSQFSDQLVDATGNEREASSEVGAGPVSIVMPSNYSNATFGLKSLETATHRSHSGNRFIPRAPDVSHTSSPSPVAKETQVSNMQQYSGSDSLLFPSQAVSSPSTDRAELVQHQHPDIRSTPHSQFRPNSPQTQRYPHAHLYLPAGMYPHPHSQLILDSVGKRTPRPGALTFSANVLHSTFEPQMPNPPISPTRSPLKIRAPLPATPGMLMSIPVEMRVSMTMPKNAAHLSPTAAHTYSGMGSKKGKIPSKPVSFHPATHAHTHTGLTGGLMDVFSPSYSKSSSPSRTADNSDNSKSTMIVSPTAMISTASVESVEQLNSSNESESGTAKNILLYTPSEDDRTTNKGLDSHFSQVDQLPPVGLLADAGASAGAVADADAHTERRDSDMGRKKANLNQANIEDELQSASPVSPKTTTVSSLTTDPIFSHYKQPAKPLRGPMYLIIQGHSKVKTYKPNVTKHSLEKARMEVQGNVGISEQVVEKNLSNFDRYVRVRENAIKEEKRESSSTEENRVLDGKKPTDIYIDQPSGTLMSLIESGLGQISTSSLPVDIVRVAARSKPELVHKRRSESE